jgi:hypothetical protein
MYCTQLNCSLAKDFIALDIEITSISMNPKNINNDVSTRHLAHTYYIEKLNFTEWLPKVYEFNLTNVNESFKYSLRMGRENDFSEGIAYLGVDKLSLEYYEPGSFNEDLTKNPSINEISVQNQIVAIVISCILAAILCGVFITFIYRNYKRPPRFRMFDDFYRASQRPRLDRYSYDF